MRRDDPDMKRAVRRVRKGETCRVAAVAECVSEATLRRECRRLGLKPVTTILRKSEWEGVLELAVRRGIPAAQVAKEQRVSRARISQLSHKLGISLPDGRKGELRWGS